MSSIWDQPGSHNQFLAALFASLSALSLGATIGWSAPAQHHCLGHVYGFPIADSAFPWINALALLGIGCVAIPSHVLAEHLGSKMVMLVAVPIYLASWALLILAPNQYVIMLARFVQGIACGSYVITVPIYCTDIAQAAVKYLLAKLFMFFYIVGTLYAYVLGAFNDYEILNYGCAALLLVFLVTFMWMPESPVFYVRQNKPEKAIKSLRWLRGKYVDIEPELLQIQAIVQQSRKDKLDVCTQLGRLPALRALLICIFLMFFQKFSGSIAIITNLTSILDMLQSGKHLAPELSSIAVGSVSVLSAMLFLLICNGRRALLIWTLFPLIISTALLGLYDHVSVHRVNYLHDIRWLPLGSLCGFMFFYSLGLAFIPILLMLELFDDNVRNAGIAIVSSMSGLFGFLSCMWFSIARYHMDIYLWTLPAIIFVALVFIYFCVPDTVGKSPAEIQKLLGPKDTTPKTTVR